MRFDASSALFVLCTLGADASPGAESRHQPLETQLPEVLFTAPDVIAEGESDTAILERLVQLCDASISGSSIHASVFLFDFEELAEAMVAANDRGVRVQVMLDWGESDARDTNAAIASRLDDRIAKFYRIENDIRKDAANHNKFIVCSRIATLDGVVESVIAQTSSNFQLRAAQKLQDLVLFQDKVVYDGYVACWKEIERLGAFCGDLESYEYRSVTGDSHKAYFFPKRKAKEALGGDSIVSILGNVRRSPESSVRIAMSLWTKGRGEILDELVELAENGASVEVVLGAKEPNGVMSKRLEELARRPRTRVDLVTTNVHSKYFLIDAEYRGEKKRLLWTGSPNFTSSALRSNLETMVRVEHDALFERYHENFTQLQRLD